MNFVQQHQNKSINKMKTNFITSCFVAVLLFSCESKEQNMDDAFAQVKEEKMLLEDSINDSQEIVEDSITTVVKIQQVKINEWSSFMLEIEKKIILNEQTIKTIKSIPNYSVKLFKKVATLEETNNNLKIKIKDYQEDEKLKMENFKQTIYLEVQEIDNQLNEITLKNQKKDNF